jgi:hypothetical protein
MGQAKEIELSSKRMIFAVVVALESSLEIRR